MVEVVKCVHKVTAPTQTPSSAARGVIIIISNLSSDRSKASSKTIRPHSAI